MSSLMTDILLVYISTSFLNMGKPSVNNFDILHIQLENDGTKADTICKAV